MERMNRRAIGILSTLVGASLWGVSGTCSQFLLANYAISSLFVTMVRSIGAAILFLAVILVKHRAAIGEIFREARARRQMIAFGVIGLFASQITYIVAIGYTNAGTATVLQSTSIVMIMLVACICDRRRPNILELIGLVLALTGTLLIATQGDLGSLSLPFAGLVWGLASAIGAACYSLLPRPLYPRWGSFTVIGIGMAIGAVASTAFWGIAFAIPEIDALCNGGNAIGSALLPALDMPAVAALAAIAVVGTFGAYFLYLNGIAMIGPIRGSQLGAIEPVSATVCSAVFMATAFTWADWIGLLLMVATIVIVAAAGKRS